MKTQNRLLQLINKRLLRVAGLMSGTSVDGIDCAVVDIQDRRVRLRAFETIAYTPRQRRVIRELFWPAAAGVDSLCRADAWLGELFAEALMRVCRVHDIRLSSVHLIGSHGQTVYHQPPQKRAGRVRPGYTMQIGEAGVIAQRTGITTVADFRPADMARGGEGAPLVPYADYVLFRDRKICRVVQNIGGIANLTYLPANGGLPDVIAFDSGPGNMVIDGLIEIISKGKRHYDRAGRLAGRGRVDPAWLGRLLRHPFFRRGYPKSTGREQFGDEYCLRIHAQAKEMGLSDADILATATCLTARSIAQAYRRRLPRLPDEVLLAGGGAHNRILTRTLRAELPEVRFVPIERWGVPADAREAVCFAVLAYACLKGIPNNVPAATGADRPLILGKIVPTS